MIWVPNQLVGAMEGDDVVLECHSEAYPKSINYWTKLNGDIILSGKIVILYDNPNAVWIGALNYKNFFFRNFRRIPKRQL